MQRKLTLLALLCLLQSTFALELEPYPSAKISEEQWNQYHAEVKKELASERGSFKYEAGELETYSEPQSNTTVAFTTPGHNAHPAWVTTQIVIGEKKIEVHVVGYFAGSEAAYQELYQKMNEMVEQTLKSFEEEEA
jgi:hypothetical protein